MPTYPDLNELQTDRNLPDYFWTAETKMLCLREALRNSLENAYAHHIQRLMVIGNFTLLNGISPKQVNDWYLSVYADALGLDVCVRQSGNQNARGTLSKKGDPEVRRLLHNAAMAASRSATWKPFYQACIARGFSCTQALVALARKIARVAFSLMKTGTQYQPGGLCSWRSSPPTFPKPTFGAHQYLPW
ncbi:transposase [Bacillus velezensis]|uniref:transposase n=1 Tax=Bacillus velezensis TaxID=492670 RepID=UPI003C6C7413